MSTISLAPAFSIRPVRRAARPAVRLTRRGRLTVLAIFLGVVLAAMVVQSGIATATLEAGKPEPVRIVQVQPGDTLYGIAGELAEPGEVRGMVQRIKDLNSLGGGSIQAGQSLAVPRG